MEDREELKRIAKRMNEKMPHANVKKMDERNRGLGFVMRYLGMEDRPVTPGEISKATMVTTARVAVIIKQLCAKGYITREADPDDARKVRITMTEKGRAFTKAREQDFENMLAEVIDEIGIETMYRYLDSRDLVFEAMFRHMSKHGLPEI